MGPIKAWTGLCDREYSFQEGDRGGRVTGRRSGDRTDYEHYLAQAPRWRRRPLGAAVDMTATRQMEVCDIRRDPIVLLARSTRSAADYLAEGGWGEMARSARASPIGFVGQFPFVPCPFRVSLGAG